MKPRLKMRERRSLRKYAEEFGGTLQLSVIAYRLCSLVLPVFALLALGAYSYASGHGHGVGVTAVAMAAAPAIAVPGMNERSKELRQKRAALIQEMHDLTEKTSFTDEAQTRWNALDKEQKGLDIQIRSIEQQSQLDDEMRRVQAPPQTQPGSLPDQRVEPRSPEEAIKRYNDRIASDEYRNAFLDWVRNGQQDCSQQSRNMLAEALREARTYTGLNTTGGSGSQGGYVIPIGFQRELEKKMKAYGRMRENCRVLNTSTGNTLDWPTYDDTSNTGSWIGENNAVNQTNPTFGQVQFSSYLGSSDQVLISVQLMQDSAFDLEGELSESFAIRLGRLTNAGYTTGTGSGEPTGLVYAIQHDASPNTVNATGSNSNDGITGNTEANSVGSDDLDNLISAVDPAYRVNGKFMMHWKSIDFLRKLKDKYGRPLWVASLADNEPDRIYGYPFDWNADMDTIGAGKYPVLFGDFQKYVIRDVGGVTMVRYNELYMPNHQVGSTLRACSTAMWNHKQFSLIDLDAEMQTGRKQIEMIGQRERLSERTSHVDDATVCSASNMKMQKPAEMTGSFRERKSNNRFKPSFVQTESGFRLRLLACSTILCRKLAACGEMILSPHSIITGVLRDLWHNVLRHEKVQRMPLAFHAAV